MGKVLQAKLLLHTALLLPYNLHKEAFPSICAMAYGIDRTCISTHYSSVSHFSSQFFCVEKYYSKSGVMNVYFIPQGTLIRVYDTSSREQLLELRRGAAHANIYWWVAVLAPHDTVSYASPLIGGGGRPGIFPPPPPPRAISSPKNFRNQITLECSVHVLITLEWL